MWSALNSRVIGRRPIDAVAPPNLCDEEDSNVWAWLVAQGYTRDSTRPASTRLRKEQDWLGVRVSMPQIAGQEQSAVKEAMLFCHLFQG